MTFLIGFAIFDAGVCVGIGIMALFKASKRDEYDQSSFCAEEGTDPRFHHGWDRSVS